MPGGISFKLLFAAAFSVVAGMNTVHAIYNPLQDLVDYKNDLQKQREDILTKYLDNLAEDDTE